MIRGGRCSPSPSSTTAAVGHDALLFLFRGFDDSEQDRLIRTCPNVLTADAPVFVMGATTGDDLATIHADAVDVTGFVVGFVSDVHMLAVATNGELELLILRASFINRFAGFFAAGFVR